MQNNNRFDLGKTFIGGFFSGLLIGTVTTLLYAPKKGADLRSDIANKATGAQKALQDSFKKGQERAQQELDDIKSKLNSLSDKTSSTVAKERAALEAQIEKTVKKAAKVDELEARVAELEAEKKL